MAIITDSRMPAGKLASALRSDDVLKMAAQTSKLASAFKSDDVLKMAAQTSKLASAFKSDAFARMTPVGLDAATAVLRDVADPMKVGVEIGRLFDELAPEIFKRAWLPGLPESVQEQTEYADVVSESIAETRSSRGKNVSTAQASAFIFGVLLLELAFVVYVSDQQAFRAVNDVFGLPANILGWLTFILLAARRR